MKVMMAERRRPPSTNLTPTVGSAQPSPTAPTTMALATPPLTGATPGISGVAVGDLVDAFAAALASQSTGGGAGGGAVKRVR